MILNNAPQNEAVVSNVGEIGEFRIRNSAKAFNILSSGLYANKVRAIVRELSTNAYDSHVAAGRKDTPFDVHMPNTLEPYFSIRDYGTGLTHEQVKNIYTTYFESTKTDSNDFVGALGLGSKSPFSYTDNFTVTAIRDGVKGIYTAFINEAGVPSIALMTQEDSLEPSGVEVKFAVNDRNDFDKFRKEAREVYKYFTLKPAVHGNADFTFELVDYESRDIIPGVHSYKSGNFKSVAIMGNIAYPIDIPRADNSLGDLLNMLSCGLELHFNIGELDFQASREGLSYIPQTVGAIKRKLEAVNTALTTVLAQEANAIANLWDRAVFLAKKKEVRLWTAAVTEYAKTANLPTYDATNKYGPRCATFGFKVADLAANWNIQIKLLSQGRGSKTISQGKCSTEYANDRAKDANGHYITWQAWNFGVDGDSHFVINDTKIGGAGRTAYHYRETGCTVYHRNIWVIEKVDRNKDMNLKAFFNAIYNPPEDRVLTVSALKQRPRENTNKDVSLLKLTRRGSRNSWRSNEDDMVWRDAGSASNLPEVDAITGRPITYYYVPLSGFTMVSSKGYASSKDFYDDVMSLGGLYQGEIYGVRKKDIEDIRKRKNWKNFEDHITEQMALRDNNKILMSLVRSYLEKTEVLSFTKMPQIISSIQNSQSPFLELVNAFKGIDRFSGNRYNIDRLFRRFCPNVSLNPDALKTKYQNMINNVNSRYPLLTKLNSDRIAADEIADYVNLIDAKKGI